MARRSSPSGSRQLPPAEEIGRIRRLADLMDSRFGIPGTSWRFGLDGLMGLIPGIGDAAGALVSFYIVLEAWRLGVRLPTLVKMVLNIGLDALAGAVPVIGDLFDFGWKANQRNIRLMERDLAGQPFDR